MDLFEQVREKDSSSTLPSKSRRRQLADHLSPRKRKIPLKLKDVQQKDIETSRKKRRSLPPSAQSLRVVSASTARIQLAIFEILNLQLRHFDNGFENEQNFRISAINSEGRSKFDVTYLTICRCSAAEKRKRLARACAATSAPRFTRSESTAHPRSEPPAMRPPPSAPYLKGSISNLSLIFQPNDQTLEGSFSSVSTPNFARKYSLESS